MSDLNVALGVRHPDVLPQMHVMARRRAVRRLCLIREGASHARRLMRSSNSVSATPSTLPPVRSIQRAIRRSPHSFATRPLPRPPRPDRLTGTLRLHLTHRIRRLELDAVEQPLHREPTRPNLGDRRIGARLTGRAARHVTLFLDCALQRREVVGLFARHRQRCEFSLVESAPLGNSAWSLRQSARPAAPRPFDGFGALVLMDSSSV
jgi:hypothetical protein